MESTREPLLKSLVDKSFTLEERWETYCKLEDSLSIDSFYIGLAFGGNEVAYYEDFYCDRNETITFSTMVERMEDREGSEEHMNLFKEDLLVHASTGTGGCVNDW